jgi:ATP-dependent Clp protease ATP-binding subunit ClpB
VFDEGRLTDTHGRVADFKNTVIILTSNLGSNYIDAEGESANAKSLAGEEGRDGGEDKTKQSEEEEVEALYQRRKDAAMEVVHHRFSPEFVGRLDEVILFRQLTREGVGSITDIQLQKVQTVLAGKEVAMTISPAARDWLAQKGFDANSGVRPLKRMIQVQILNPLATVLIDGALQEGGHVEVGLASDVEDLSSRGRALSIHACGNSSGK